MRVSSDILNFLAWVCECLESRPEGIDDEDAEQMDVTTRRLAELKMARRDRAEGVGRTSRRAPAFMQSDDESDDGVLRTRRRRHYELYSNYHDSIGKLPYPAGARV